MSNAGLAEAATLTPDADKSRARESFNVVNYGAVGNGTANDTAAIQDALDDAQAVNGRVYFPAGDYAVETLNITEAITLEGEAAVLGYPNAPNLNQSDRTPFGGNLGAVLRSRSGGDILHYGIGGDLKNSAIRRLRFIGPGIHSASVCNVITIATGRADAIQGFNLEDLVFEDVSGWCFFQGAGGLTDGFYNYHWRNLRLFNVANGIANLTAGPACKMTLVYVGPLKKDGWGIDFKNGDLTMECCQGGGTYWEGTPAAWLTGGNTGGHVRLRTGTGRLKSPKFEYFYGTAVAIDNDFHLEAVEGGDIHNSLQTDFGIGPNKAFDWYNGGAPGVPIKIDGVAFQGGNWPNGHPFHMDDTPGNANYPRIGIVAGDPNSASGGSGGAVFVRPYSATIPVDGVRGKFVNFPTAGTNFIATTADFIYAKSLLIGTPGTTNLNEQNRGHRCTGWWADFVAFNPGSVGAGATVADVTDRDFYCDDLDEITVTPPKGATPNGLIFTAVCTATNKLRMRAHNVSAGALTPLNGNYRVVVRRYAP